MKLTTMYYKDMDSLVELVYKVITSISINIYHSSLLELKW